MDGHSLRVTFVWLTTTHVRQVSYTCAHRADVIEIFYRACVRSEVGWHMAIVMNLYIL